MALRANRSDVHTVITGGEVAELERRLVGADLASARREIDTTVEHLRSELGTEDPRFAGPVVLNP